MAVLQQFCLAGGVIALAFKSERIRNQAVGLLRQDMKEVDIQLRPGSEPGTAT